MNGGMRLAEVSGQAAIESKDGYGFDYEAGLLAEFAGDGCFGSFSCFDPAGGKSPEGIIYALFQKNLALGIEQRALNAYFGCDIAEFPGEALADVISRKAGKGGIFACC